MLYSLALSAFKGFGDPSTLDIRPITVLCGPNSCGKSSILQSILLFKQTVESRDPSQVLLMNGRFAHLGSFEDIVFQHKGGKQVTFEFSFKLGHGERPHRTRHLAIPIDYILNQLVPRAQDADKELDYFLRYRICLQSLGEKNGQRLQKSIAVEEINVETGATSASTMIPGVHLNLRLKDPSKEVYSLSWENLAHNQHQSPLKTAYPPTGNTLVRIEFSNLYSRSWTAESAKPRQVDWQVMRLFEWVYHLLQGVFGSLTYIGPLREEPNRRYIFEDEIVEIGVKGENAAYLYLSEQKAPLVNHYFYNYNLSAFEQKRKISLSQAVDYWLDQMNIKHLRPEQKSEIIYLRLDSASSARTRVSIADVGFGVSQIFPIILEGLRMPTRATLLLEQPEIHLHPNLQMQMADYFISLALSDKGVIVETHSDHIINRLVRRIVEHRSDWLRKLVAIYFIRPTNDGAKIEQIEIDPMSGIVNWPREFFDQNALEQERIIRAGLKKRTGFTATDRAQ